MDVLLRNGIDSRMNLNKIYIISGESSGDLHAGKLCLELKKRNPDLMIRGWGGQHLASAGAVIDVRYEKVNFMGFTEVLKNLSTIFKLFRQTKKSILEFKPDALILIDYPGFNLRMATWASKHGIPVYYYIAPQVWAWKEKRVRILKEAVKKLFIILPFEKDYFASHGIQAYYYGHPLVPLIHSFQFDRDFRIKNNLSNKAIIALLPGSRKQEIQTMLPIFLESIKAECKYQIVVAGMNQHKQLYEGILQTSGVKVHIVYNDTYNLLHQSHLAIVTSGTATLETGLFGVPEIVCYKGNHLSYLLAKKLIKVKFICLVNLIADKKVVQELIQQECNPIRIKEELSKLKDHLVKRHVKSELKEIHHLLAGNNPYENVALEMMKDFN